MAMTKKNNPFDFQRATLGRLRAGLRRSSASNATNVVGIASITAVSSFMITSWKGGVTAAVTV